MSISFSRSPPQSPSAASGGIRQAPFAGRQHRRGSTQGSSASFSSFGDEALLGKSSYDGYRPTGSSRDVPTSPTSSSTTSNGERSPRSFYSFAQASTSTVKERDYAAYAEEEDDLGDRTFMGEDDTPKKADYSAKGKGRAEEPHVSERSMPLAYSADTTDQPQDDQYANDDDEDSARIEQTLRAWAKKEKLRRAKTRSRQIAPAPQAPAIVTDAVSGIARRVSQVRRSNTISSAHPNSRNRERLSSVDPMAADRSPFHHPADDMELQPPNARYRPAMAARSHTSPTTSPQQANANGLQQPLSATSATFPLLDRIERAAKTGSRFIEDLEDQEMQQNAQATNPTQSYAEMRSNPTSPLASPAKPRGRLRINIGRPAGDSRTHSFASVASSFGKGDHSPLGSRTASPRGSVSSLKSPVESVPPPRLFYSGPDESSGNLVLTPRASRDFDSPFGDQYESRRRQESDEDASFLGRGSNIGWLEYFFCCGCFGAGVSLEDDDAQAGRTFPE